LKQDNLEQRQRNVYYRGLLEDGCTISRDFFAQDFSQSSIFDVGSGPEGILHVLECPCKIAVDPLMDVYRDQGYPIEFNHVTTICRTGESFDLGTEVDYALCLNALDHCRDPQAVVANISRNLKVGGEFLLLTDLRTAEHMDGLHKLVVTEEMVRNWLNPHFDITQWHVFPHQAGNPVMQLVVRCTKASKVLLVGNGPSVLDRKLGAEIDAFDGPVVRFNSYRIPGYDEYVGTRTDIWVTCDAFPAWWKDYQKVICCSYHRSQDNKILVKLRERYQCDHFPEWAWDGVMNRMNFNAPSSGAVATEYFAKDHRVYLYGFDFFAGDKHHYGDTVDGCHHQGVKELEYFMGLMQDGKVIPFHDYLKDHNYAILHKLYPSYGVGGNWYRNKIMQLANGHHVASILDYGCGKGSLVRLLAQHLTAYGYDPYVSEFAKRPTDSVDMVVTTDFWEHIPEDEIDAVLDDIESYSPRVEFHSISNRKAAQILPDGTNAHATIKPPEWWAERLYAQLIEHNDGNNFTIYHITR